METTTKGISWYQKCINIELKILGDDHIEIAADYNNIGEAYHQKHDEESALKYLMLALKIKEKTDWLYEFKYCHYL